MSKNIIERSIFDSLKDSIGVDFTSELINTFGEEALVMIANLRQALSDKNGDAFRREAHSMKTNAATFGALELTELAKSLEYLARDNQLDQVGDQLDILESLYNEAQSELERLSNDE